MIPAMVVAPMAMRPVVLKEEKNPETVAVMPAVAAASVGTGGVNRKGR